MQGQWRQNLPQVPRPAGTTMELVLRDSFPSGTRPLEALPDVLGESGGRFQRSDVIRYKTKLDLASRRLCRVPTTSFCHRRILLDKAAQRSISRVRPARCERLVCCSYYLDFVNFQRFIGLTLSQAPVPATPAQSQKARSRSLWPLRRTSQCALPIVTIRQLWSHCP